jgi:uncharacterized membrane protein YdjX (TVP38/TMEM64 family)
MSVHPKLVKQTSLYVAGRERARIAHKKHRALIVKRRELDPQHEIAQKRREKVLYRRRNCARAAVASIAGLVLGAIWLGGARGMAELTKAMEIEEYPDDASRVAVVFALIVAWSFPIPGYSGLLYHAGRLFGVWYGAIIAYLAATVGGVLCFLLTRLALGWVAARLVRRQRFELPFFIALVRAVKRWGLSSLIVVRIMPLPYGLCNFFVGLSRCSIAHYILALAITNVKVVAYTYAGASEFEAELLIVSFSLGEGLWLALALAVCIPAIIILALCTHQEMRRMEYEKVTAFQIELQQRVEQLKSGHGSPRSPRGSSSQQAGGVVDSRGSEGGEFGSGPIPLSRLSTLSEGNEREADAAALASSSSASEDELMTPSVRQSSATMPPPVAYVASREDYAIAGAG